jgi:phosphate transport system permease protein
VPDRPIVPLPQRVRRNDRAFTVICWILGSLGFVLPAGIVFYLVVNGVRVLSWEFVTALPEGFPLGTAGGIWPAIQGSFALVGLGLAIAFPLALLAAVFLTEYAPFGRFVQLCRFAAEALASIPSILYGVFGYAFLVVALGFRISLLSGGITIALLIFPILLIGIQEALRRTDALLRESVLSLGVGRDTYIRHIALRKAAPGIVAITVLAAGHAFGTAAPILLTASVVHAFGRISLEEPIMTLPTHLYYLVTEAVSFDYAYGTALVLVIALLATNFTALLIKKRLR